MKISHARSHWCANAATRLTAVSTPSTASCLAVPIYDYTRKVMAAMSVSGHGLLDRCEEVYVYEKMRDAALDLSHHMGYTEVKLPAGRTHL